MTGKISKREILDRIKGAGMSSEVWALTTRNTFIEYVATDSNFADKVSSMVERKIDAACKGTLLKDPARTGSICKGWTGLVGRIQEIRKSNER